MIETRNADERVVLIGMGVLAPTPNGETVDGFWDDAINVRHGFKPIPEIIGPYGKEIGSRTAAVLPPFHLGELLTRHGFAVGNEKDLRRNIDKSHKTAQGVVYAGAQALRQATILSTDSLAINQKILKPKHFGVYQGTGVAGAPTIAELQTFLDDRVGINDGKQLELAYSLLEMLKGQLDEFVIADFRKYLEEQVGGSKRKQSEFAYSLLQLLVGRVDELAAKIFLARGNNDTYNTECAASLSAGNEAVEHIRNGKILVALAGGVEMAVHPTLLWAFEALQAVDTTNDPMTIPRPFDETRQGLGFGEGVAEVVLARLDYVQWLQKMGHKVTIFAEVLGTGSSSDAHHDSFPSDEGPGQALDIAIAEAGYEPSELYDVLVEAHAPGTLGDAGEVKTITKRLKPKQVVGIVSIKGLIGHTFGAAGAFGVVSAAKSMATKALHPNRNLNFPIPETAGYPMVPHRAIKVKNIRFAIINSFGFGGKNRVMLLGKFSKRPSRASKLKGVQVEEYANS